MRFKNMNTRKRKSEPAATSLPVFLTMDVIGRENVDQILELLENVGFEKENQILKTWRIAAEKQNRKDSRGKPVFTIKICGLWNYLQMLQSVIDEKSDRRKKFEMLYKTAGVNANIKVEILEILRKTDTGKAVGIGMDEIMKGLSKEIVQALKEINLKERKLNIEVTRNLLALRRAGLTTFSGSIMPDLRKSPSSPFTLASKACLLTVTPGLPGTLPKLEPEKLKVASCGARSSLSASWATQRRTAACE